MAIHSSILAWRIPWAEEPGGQHSIGLQSQIQLKWLSTHASVVCSTFCVLSRGSWQRSGRWLTSSPLTALLASAPPVTQNLQPNHSLNHWCSLQGLFANSVGCWQVKCLGLGLRTVGSHRVGHDWCDLAAAAAAGLRNPSVWEKVLKHEVMTSWEKGGVYVQNTGGGWIEENR